MARDQVADEALVIGGVDQRAELRPVADLGQRVGELWRAEAQVLLAPQDGERQEIALLAAVGRDLHDREPIRLARQARRAA